MKITGIYLYPIKGLRGIPLKEARLTPQGVKYDRRFSLWRLNEDGSLKDKIQVFTNPECSLFEQRVVGLGESDIDEEEDVSYARFTKPCPGGEKETPAVIVRYITPQNPIVPKHPAHDTPLRVPLCPDTTDLDPVTVTMYKSSAAAYRMGDLYDAWFTACFGFPIALVYIGDGKRPQLGFQPLALARMPRRSKPYALLYALLGYVTNCIVFLLTSPLLAYREKGKDCLRNAVPWVTFTDFAPFLVTSESSLADLSSRVGDKPLEMHRFRPNIIIGPSATGSDPFDDLPPWDEDFWSELSVAGSPTFKLTGNCARCTSVNVDYDTGRPTEGLRGDVLKTMARCRRVDKGKKWQAIFGRYASLATPHQQLNWWRTSQSRIPNKVALGDEVCVTTRNPERDVWDWPPLK
ncbi:hypothetical protein jhhlp_003542 [Lomentospora prolificans]|uniref:MOSC domain-containing protein n=1 Tax=Lomentospora prolificans TaxID=41688 RepID=A0A2N3N913_9PEZI|nr:hypothetical protein jhhlp_003542 [Lomentospora prolificans]